MSELWFVKLHRKTLENAISKNLEFLWLFSALLLKASFQKKEFYLWYKKIELKPWQFVSSVRKLSLEFRVSVSKMYRMLEVLKSEHIVEHEWNTKYSLFTIVNRHKYQVCETQSGTQSRQQTKHEWDTIKNDNKDKNEKEDISSTKKSELQVEDVVDYIRKFIEKKSNDFLQISSQIKKIWLDAYLVQGEEARQKLLAKGYTDEQIKLALEWAVGDEFRDRQIRTPRKLLEKNKEWVLYIDVMLDVANALLAKKRKDAMR